MKNNWQIVIPKVTEEEEKQRHNTINFSIYLSNLFDLTSLET